MIPPARRLACFTLLLAACFDEAARGELPPQPTENATLVVEGLVRESFRSVRATRVDFVFELEVRSAQVGSAPETPLEGVVPKSGDLLYVRAFERRPDAPQVPGPVGYRSLPAEGDLVRAHLYPGNGGGWQFAYPLGFERIGRGESVFGPEPTDLRPGSGTGTALPRRIGVMVMPVGIGNRMGLRVNEVTPGTPAHRAGLEPGDLILEADNLPTRTIAELTAQVAGAGRRLRLVIRNVRTGMIQPLEVDLGGSE